MSSGRRELPSPSPSWGPGTRKNGTSAPSSAASTARASYASGAGSVSFASRRAVAAAREARQLERVRKRLAAVGERRLDDALHGRIVRWERPAPEGNERRVHVGPGCKDAARDGTEAGAFRRELD